MTRIILSVTIQYIGTGVASYEGEMKGDLKHGKGKERYQLNIHIIPLYHYYVHVYIFIYMKEHIVFQMEMSMWGTSVRTKCMVSDMCWISIH